MEDTRFIKSIRLRNLLSFGPESEEIELGPLNVLIGPNGSGKSNFIDAISILQAAPRDVRSPFRKGGGVKEWIWKGDKEEWAAEIYANVVLYYRKSVEYTFGFSVQAEKMEIDDEIITVTVGKNKDTDNIYKFDGVDATVKVKKSQSISLKARVSEKISSSDFDSNKSILSQLKSSFEYPEITKLGNLLEKTKIYKNLSSEMKSNARTPQQTDLPGDFLSENLQNLALIVNHLKDDRKTRDIFKKSMEDFYYRYDYIGTQIIGGTAQLCIYEKGYKYPISATRLSDGTILFLSLLSILSHPSPPPLICIEEPEIGLHPDIIPTIAELLVEASKRTQLIVTTHSDILVSALSDQPESILVCEHDDRGTNMRRLEREKLKEWLKKYMLGEIWRMGEIGGNRW